MSSGTGAGATGQTGRRVGKAGVPPLGSTPAGTLISATGGPGGLFTPAATGGSRSGLYAFDAAELETFSLPPLKSAAHASPKRMPGASGPLGRTAGSGTDGLTGADRTGVGAGAGAGRGALTATFPLVKEALGLAPLGSGGGATASFHAADDAKLRELDDLYAGVLGSSSSGGSGSGAGGAAGAGSLAATGKSRRAAALAASTAAALGAGGTSLPASAGLTGGDELAAQALIEVDRLRTGEEAIAFFQKYGPTCPVKFVYLRRKYPPHHDTYRPYELVVVPQKDAGPDHYVMSSKGIVHIEPGMPSEFSTLAEWMHDAASFNVCIAMRFFKQYLPRKIFGTWRANVRFQRYCKQRDSVCTRLFTWKPAFAAALVEIKACLSRLEQTPLVHLTAPRYTIASFIEAQASARAEAVKAIERQVAAVQAAIERVCADVVKRARAHDDDDDDDAAAGGVGGGGGGGAGAGAGGAASREAGGKAIKSMAAARLEAVRRAAALKSAAEEEAMLGSFVRLADYMVVETAARMLIGQFQAFLRDLTFPEQRRVVGVASDARSGGGMFVTTVRFDPHPGRSGTLFDPPLHDFTRMLDILAAESVKAASAAPRVLFARSVREYVQELPTEAGPGNLSAPTVQKLIAEAPEFARAREGLEARFAADFAAAAAYASMFDTVRPVFDYANNGEAERFRAKEQTIVTLQREMGKIKQWDLQVSVMRMQETRGCLFIDSKRLRQDLEPVTVTAMESIKSLLLEVARERCRRTGETFKARMKTLEGRPTSLDKFATHVERASSIKEGAEELIRDFVAVQDMYKLLAGYEVKVNSEDAVALDDLVRAHADFEGAVSETDRFLDGRLPEMTRQLDVSIIKVNDGLKAISDSVNEGIFVDEDAPPAAVLEALDGVKAKLAALEEQGKRFNKWQQLFGVAQYDFKAIPATQKAVALREQLWSTLHSFEQKYTVWTQGPFAEVDVEELARDVHAFQKTSFTLDKQVADGVSALLKSRVADFKQYLPVLMDLGNRSMRERHWKRLYEACGQAWLGNNPDRTLSELMSFRIFDHAEEVAEVSGNASGEAQLEGSLAKIVTAWESTSFVVKRYREQKGVYILGGLEDIMTQLEDHQVMLQTMMGSRFIAGVREEVEAWDRRLSLLSDTLDEWIMCQKQWMYLETIFSAEDIQRQLPAEASKFAAVDRRWKDIMFRTNANPLVIASVEGGEELLRAFQSSNATLEAVQKSLEEYLTTKRDAFPRFYFLSNDELLAILSQTKDPTAVQPHLVKCFDAIKSVKFGTGANAHEMFGMLSSDGEVVEFSAPVSAAGNVEDWLSDVEAMMRATLYDQAKSALERHPPREHAIDRSSWFFTAAAQCIIMVDQITWTAGCTDAILAVQEGRDSRALHGWHDFNRRQIEAIVALVRGNLTRQQRTLLGALVVIDVHARDVVSAMAKKGVGSLEDFEWTKQLRYYWDLPDPDNCIVRQTNTNNAYCYEYLGNSERLVITPLTDQCYMTLTGALHLKFGGAPQGPAGTGKTETTKDLAKALAMQCVVFNCSDGLDYKMMGRFFAGLAQAGAWACFDEFNRIDIEVLSVIAQQVLTIQQGLIAREPRILFEGRDIPLSPSFGCFITMNPGYAGRTELPDNLKALFRPVAMMVPDYRLIAEIILFSQGFTEAARLSYKMVQLYKLSSEQLSRATWYDFGMRAVKSVLVAAGQLKRKEPDVPEDVLLIRAMRDSNVPKFLEQDLPLFRGIISDLFPGVEVPFVDYGKLQTAIVDQLHLAGLQPVPTLVTKIIQTHETQLVRHGMMIVGEAGSGKTTNATILARALTQLHKEGVIDKDGAFQHVTVSTLNPKSITMGELYGETNPTTQEWRDGLVATLVRQGVADTSAARKWIVFDGPVDALWIENLNTVLDDNKMLCLTNGERIKLPPTMHMMFEVRDLAVASPATVSRCGMVYMEPLHVGVQALVESWGQGQVEDLLPDEAPRILGLLRQHIPAALAFLRQHCSEIIPSQDSNLVTSFLSLLLTLLSPSNGVRAPFVGCVGEPRSAAQKAREAWVAAHGGDMASLAGHGPGGAGAADDEDGEGGAAAGGAGAAPAAPAAASTPSADADGDGGAAGVKRRLPVKNAMDPAVLARLIDVSYVFAFVWSFGANLHDRSRARFNAFALQLLRDLLPQSMRPAEVEGGATHASIDALVTAAAGSGGGAAAADGGAGAGAAPAGAAGTDLFGLYVDVPSASLRDWRTRMATFTYVPGAPYFSILVPTVDTTRTSVLVRTLLESGRSVLVSGETGVGKSVVVADTLARMSAGDDAKFVYATVNFSAQTRSANLQEAMESSLDRKRRTLLGAPAGKRMVIFVDDLNMPQKETYGAQPPLELLRQVVDAGAFYDRQRLFLKHITDVVFAASCAPPGGGRNELPTRLARHYHMMWMPALSEDSMVTIFQSILGGFLGCESPALAGAAADIVGAAVALYRRVESELLPTPAKSHYTFNLRDLSKVFQGMLMVTAAQLPDRDALLRLWVHEEQRVFRDRLISAEDRTWFNTATAELLAGPLRAPWPVAEFENVLYGDYAAKGAAGLSGAARPYQQVKILPTQLGNLLSEYQEEYNVTFPSPMHLVFFQDAVAHVSRIARILRQPRGNALLVGVGGSGRRSLCRLAAFMAEYSCSSIEITRGYGVNEWHGDLKKLLMGAGIKGKDTVFLFSDTQIVKESFLEDINNILNAGDVPNLYAPDEMEAIINGCRAGAKTAGFPETRTGIFAYYVSQAREHLHIVLCMSPIGAAFRTRCRQFPSLVNCCTIDWFNAWPEEALASVARSFLSDTALALGTLAEPLANVCVRMHMGVESASARFLATARRYNYTTPTSYLELLRLYVSMLQQQRDIVSRRVARYRGGLTKLAATNALVADLQAKLVELQPVLTAAAADTAALLVRLAADQKEADAAAAIAAKDEADTAVVAAGVAAIKADCQKDLDEALPAYYAAMKALKSLDKKQIQEVKSFANPPRLVGVVLEAVCVLMGTKETWDEAKKLMNQMNFLEQLMEFKKDEVAPKVIAKLQRYLKDPEFKPEVVSKVSSAATSLCMWVIAIAKYDEVARTIAPKKEKLAAAEAELAAAQGILAEKRAALAAVQARLASLQASYNASLAQRDELDAKMKATSQRLERAHKLTGGLGDEATRWAAAAAQLETDMGNLVGNMALAAGCVAYLGPFTARFRSDLVSDWVTVCKDRGIPVDGAFSLTRLLADPVQVREWNIQGLPADDFSTENALYATLGRRWPLMIDPQGQANRWVKAINAKEGLQIIKLSQPDFLRTLENAIRFGQPVLLENVEEELDPALEPVLLKQVFKKGGQPCLRLGDTDVPYSDSFRLYITTKLANPHYMPEVCIKVTIINFTVTLRGLEDQLLVDVVRKERPDLEAKKDELIVSIAGDKRALKEIEDKILQMLADSTGDILDDEELIASLGASKTTSVAIGERMREAEVTTQEITTARETYRPVATRGSVLYFVIADLAGVDSMYQYSLQAFTRLYNLRIAKAPQAETPAARVAVLIDDMTRAFYANVCRGLFETHKLLYAFLIAAQVQRAANGISDAEWTAFLLGGGASTDGHAEMPAPCKAWLPPKAWSGISAAVAAAAAAFAGLTAELTANADGAWKAWVTGKAPESEPLPGGPRWAALTPFQRLLLLRGAREERTVQGVREFVRAELGSYFCEPPRFDLEGTYADSSSSSPIIFILSPGADPIDYLLKLAKAKGKSAESFRIISLGQGQGPIAERMMEAARKSGDWVCLQNCHLAVSWLPRMEALLEAASTGAAGAEHPDYRLWLTSMPSDKFPVPVLQNAIKITNEPPRGIKANLIRTFNDVGEKEYESSSKPADFKKLLFGLAFYHALVLERRKFGAVGWNISYDFANSDLKAGMMHLRMYLEEQPGVPYETLNNVVGDITYGGRVTDKWDKRTNLSLLTRFFCPELIESNPDAPYAFSESGAYFCPAPGPLAALRSYIESLPIEDAPEVFGLHENASISLQMKETSELMATIVSVQPRAGGGGGGGGGAGKSNDEIVLDLVADITARLPALLSKAGAHPASFAVIGDGSMNSLGVFLEQEISRFNALLKVMRGTLEQLGKAVRGLVVMSASLETMAQAFLLQRVPPEWEAAAYPSLKPLGSWVVDLFARIAALASWVKNGPPAAFWISGFFFPQGFTTGVLQVHARKTRLAIDTLDFRTEVMSFDETAVPEPPANGAYIYGLFLEGARWDRAARRLADSAPGVLFDRMPCMWLDPVRSADIAYPANTYTSPFYKTSKRAGVLTTTGHSSNFVMTLFLPSDKPQEHWVRRGTAVLSMLDD